MLTYRPGCWKYRRWLANALVLWSAQLAGMLVTFTPVEAQVVIDFEALTPPVKVFGQYSNAGISFNGPLAIKHSPRLTRSGRTGIEPCFAIEFCTAPIVMKIAAGKRGVRLWVGSSIPRPQLTIAVMRAYDSAGLLVGETTGELGPSPTPIFTSRQLRIENAARDIRRVTLGYAPGPEGPRVNNGLLVDDVELLPRDGAKPHLDTMEVVQATQTFDTSVPLVADKASVVRAFIGIPGLTGSAVSVTGKLIARRPGGAFVGSIDQTASLDLSAAWPQARLRENGALNFRIPDAWTAAGYVTFELAKIAVNGGAPTACLACARTAHFRPVRPLNLVLAPYIYNQETPSQVPDLLLTPMGSLQWMNNIYPLSGEFPAQGAGVRILRYLPLAATNFKSHSEDGKFLNELEAMRLLLRSQNPSWPDFRLMGLVSCAHCGGAAPYNGRVLYSYMAAQSTSTPDPASFEIYGSTMAHELGHSFDRRHAGNAHNEAAGGGYDANFPFAHGGIGDPGVATITNWWDPERRFMEPGNPFGNHEHDLMSYGHGLPGDTGAWISPYTYKALFAKLTAPEAAAVAPQPPAREVLVVIGHVDANGQPSLRPFWRLTTSLISSAGLSGDYRVELLNARGEVMLTHYFDATETGAGDTRLFSELVPWVAETREIRLSGPDGELSRQTVSARAPWVRVNEPRYNTGRSQLSVSWSAGDADRDPLTFAVLYSDGKGKAWLPVADGVRGSSVDVDTRLLPGSATARLRVIVSDGANTAQADSVRPFASDNRLPMVGIMPPAKAAQTSAVEPAELLGVGYDPEDGLLDQAQLRWSSDRDGALGSGSRIMTKNLSRGRHNIMLEGCDLANNCATRTVEINLR